jgi:hypothetical protein
MFDTGYIIIPLNFPSSQEGSPEAIRFFEAVLYAREGVVFGDWILEAYLKSQKPINLRTLLALIFFVKCSSNKKATSTAVDGFQDVTILSSVTMR